MLCYSAGKGLPTGLSFELVNPKNLDEAEKQLLEVRPLYSSKFFKDALTFFTGQLRRVVLTLDFISC